MSTVISYSSLPPVSLQFMLDFSSRINVLGGPIGTGKAQPVDTPVATPDGWRKLGDLQLGDHVLGSDGTPTAVTGIYPQGVKPINLVEMSDGSHTHCCDEHLWLTHTQNERGSYAKPKVRDTATVRQTLRTRNGAKNHRIPMCRPLQFTKKPLLIDPYVLGVLLGDGGLSTSSVKLSSPDQFILDKVTKRLPAGIWLKRIDPAKYDYHLRGQIGKGSHTLMRHLRHYGLMGLLSWQKHIPADYLQSDVEDRVALLHGLMDTDGTCDLRTGSSEYDTSSPKLAEGVAELVESLGGTAKTNIKKTTHKDSYRITVSLPPDIMPFSLPRKLQRHKPKTKYPPSRFITGIHPAGFAECVCISVSADDRLYVTEHSIVTHNTIAQCLKLMLAAVSIVPDKHGVRKTRFIVVRKRYGDLEASFVKDMETVVAPGVFKLTGKRSPMVAQMEFPYTAPDGTGKRVECEIYMYAFEEAPDVAKIKSLKFTCGFIIEAQELSSPDMYMKIYERLGRFPTPDNADSDLEAEYNTALTWHLPDGTTHQGPFLSMDINYPNVRHHFKQYIIDKNPVQPDGNRLRRLHMQPPTHHFVAGATLEAGAKGVVGVYKGEAGVFVRNPEAVHYVKHNKWQYWEDLLKEMMGDDALIQQNILAEFGDHISGKPVYPRFRRHIHVASAPLTFAPGIPVIVGVDQNFNNTWVYMQMMPSGTINVVAEIVNVKERAKSMAAAVEEDVIPFANQFLYNHLMIKYIIDQAALVAEGGHGVKQIEILNKAGLDVKACPEKFTTPMRELVTTALSQHRVLISPNCPHLIDGLAGGFNYPLDRSTGLYSNTPDQKSEYSHTVNAFEFGMTELLRKGGRKKSSGKKRDRENPYL